MAQLLPGSWHCPPPPAGAEGSGGLSVPCLGGHKGGLRPGDPTGQQLQAEGLALEEARLRQRPYFSEAKGLEDMTAASRHSTEAPATGSAGAGREWVGAGTST